MPTVYVDLLLALNGFIDGLLLSAVAALRRLPHTRFRLLLGGAAGAVFSLVILLPALSAAVLALYDALTAAVMVLCAFSFRGWRDTLKSVGLLYLLSAGFSGLSFLLWTFVAPAGFFVFNGTVYYDVSPVFLLCATLVCYGVSRLYECVSSRAVKPARLLTIIAENRGQTVQFSAFHDTGFSLCDGFSGSPVILVDRTVAAPLLPADFGEAGSGFRLIPCHTVAGDELLYGFRPARLTLVTERSETPLSGTILAVSDSLKNAPYTALCGDDVAKFLTK